MNKNKSLKTINFSKIGPDHVRRMVEELYAHKLNEKRDAQFGQVDDRRQDEERRRTNKHVMLDTRSKTGRRRSSGRRQQDENGDNNYHVGIDYYI